MQPVLTNFKFYLEGSLVNATSSFTYQGVNVSNTILFNVHTSQTVQKASTLYMFMRALKGALCQAKPTALLSICIPLLEYTSEI